MPRRMPRIKDPSSINENEFAADSFEYFATNNFQGKIPPRFSRKEIRHPVLRSTPVADKEAARKTFKILLRFMGDVTDYRHNMSKSSQPNMGSIITRLKKEMGIDTTNRFRGSREIAPHGDDDLPMTGLPNKPRIGTMSKLTATIAARFFRTRSRATVWQMLPLEETLRGSFDQIHFIVGYGLLQSTLRDEIYCQICKQLVDNPFSVSIPQGWLLLHMIAGCFLPSEHILKLIVKFADDGPPMHATNVRQLLRRTLSNGERCQPPSHIEIEAALQGKPLSVSVTLMDGSTQLVAVDAQSTSKEVCEKVARAIGLRDRFGFSLYISMQNKVASLGNDRDHVMDSISQCEQIFRDQDGDETDAPWQLFFRKEIFMPWETTVKDPVATNLIYAQVVRGIMMGEYNCDSLLLQVEDLAVVVARQCYIEHGADLNAVDLRSLLPACLPASEVECDVEALDRWVEVVHATYKRLFPSGDPSPPSSYGVRLDIVRYAKTRWPLSFSRYFDVTKLDGPAWDDEMFSLAINSSGVYILGECKQTLHKMAFHEISQVLGDSGPNSVFRHVITFEHVSGAMMTFETVDSDDIRQLIHSMTNGILQRSTFAVATQNFRGIDDGEVDIEDGDLCKLSTPAGSGAFTSQTCKVTNQTSGRTGQVNSFHIHVLATLAAPSPDYLRLLRASSRHRITNTAPSSTHYSHTLRSSRSGDTLNSTGSRSGHIECGRELSRTSKSSSGASARPSSSRS